jgi:hypothetical protein
MAEKIILVESRVSDLREKFSRKFSQEQMEKIIDEIPSKYYPWAAKMLDQIGFDSKFPVVKNLLDYFNKFGSNLAKTDIFQYDTIEQLQDELNKYAEKQKRNYKKVQGANVVYDSPKYLVVNPLSHESSCYYGKGTKWCTSGRDSADTFNRYNADGKIFYIINKTLPSSDPNYKIALSLKFDGDESFHDAVDVALRNPVLFETSEFKTLIERIKSYLNTEYSEQVQTEQEKKRQKMEAEKQRRIEAQRIKRAKRAEADERRVEQEWALTNEIDDEGKMAWAVLNYLENEGAEVRDREQEERLSEIQIQLDQLNSEYEADPEFRSDIYDQITELEDERDEILEMIDVYYIIPVKYKHYGLSQFEVTHDDFYQQTFAVGTESEVEEAAEDYVNSLIDDIGVAGFNKTFYSNYIDEEAVLSYARDLYEDDVNQNPDVYLSDDDRLLSEKQVDQINYKKNVISKLEIQKDDLEDLALELEDEDQIESIEERVQEFEDQIEELQNDIEEIESEPDGDWPDELIEEKVENLVNDVERNIEYFMEEHGLNIDDYIDMDRFVKAVVEEDGYGQLSPYDGRYETFKVMGEEYYVFRID